MEGVKKVYIPASVTTIGGNVFSNCHSLVTAKLSENMTTLCNSLFVNCENLTTVTGLGDVKLIGQAFNGSAQPATVKALMLDRIDAKHSNIGDRFLAKTTEDVTIGNKTFAKGSTLEGRVVTVMRPGIRKCYKTGKIGNFPGSVTVKFTHISDGDQKIELPETMSSATAEAGRFNSPNFVARLFGFPFATAARTVGIVGRGVGEIVNIAGDGLEEYGDRLSDTFVETLTGHPGRGAASFGNSFVTLGKGVYGIIKTTVSGTFGIIYEFGDEVLYTIVPHLSESSALNPNESITVVF